MKFVFLILLTVLVQPEITKASETEVLEGDICRVEISSRRVNAKVFKNVYIEFDQNLDENFLAYSTIFGLPEANYNMLFRDNSERDFDNLPFELSGSLTSDGYLIYFYALKSMNGETLNGYRHETLHLLFNENQQLRKIDAEYIVKWPLPRDLFEGKTITKTCIF